MTKTCTKCGSEKAIEQFDCWRGSADGHWTYCKDCRKQFDLKQRAKNKERNQAGEYQRPDGTKKCSDCQQEKPTTEFFREAIRGDGLSYLCKSCSQARRKATRERHKKDYLPKTDGTKLCRSCSQSKHVSEFTVLRSNPDGLRGACRECEAKAYAEIRREVLSHYSEGQLRCAHCGLNDEAVLTIDHVNDDGAAHRKALNGLPIYLALKRAGFPTGVRVLCWNCNCRRQYRKEVTE